MVDRIKKVMEYYEFTPSDFADALGVSRSNLTHVFSGRNQPSLDFARRVLMAFPEVSSEWLIMGVGEMIKPAGSEPEPPKKYIQTDLFATAEEELGWGESNENNEELGMRNEGSGVRSQMSEGESEEGNRSSVELGMRNEEVNESSEMSDVRGQKSEVRSDVENENRNVNSDQIKETFVTNDANEPLQSQEQKITTNENMPKIGTKQADTKIVRQRKPLPSTSSESNIQHRPAPVSRIYDSRGPVSASEKKVVKIIFFYDDDSFKIYHP